MPEKTTKEPTKNQPPTRTTLRLDHALAKKINKDAAANSRSFNAHVCYLLREALAIRQIRSK